MDGILHSDTDTFELKKNGPNLLISLKNHASLIHFVAEYYSEKSQQIEDFFGNVFITCLGHYLGQGHFPGFRGGWASEYSREREALCMSEFHWPHQISP